MSRFHITPWRAWFINRNFFEWSFGKDDDSVPDIEKFDRLNPAELHYLASIYNWDDGPCVLEWIVDSPLCSKATANLIFWRARPDFYRSYELDAVKPTRDYDENYDVLRILRKIIARHRNNDFSPLRIAFNPSGELEDLTNPEPKWDVPKALYEHIRGTEVRAVNPRVAALVAAVAVVIGLAWWFLRKRHGH